MKRAEHYLYESIRCAFQALAHSKQNGISKIPTKQSNDDANRQLALQTNKWTHSACFEFSKTNQSDFVRKMFELVKLVFVVVTCEPN